MKVQFTHSKNIPGNNAIYELLESDRNTEKVKCSDYNWINIYTGKVWYLQSLIDLKTVCGWVVTYL